MGWFDENGFDGGIAHPSVEPNVYEQGGFAGAPPAAPQPSPAAQPGYADGGPVSVGSGQTPAAAAFDPNAQVGHDGTFNGMTREQYRDAWMSSGVNSVAGMKDWIAKHGGQWLADNGTVRTPFGEVLDMGGNARGSAAGNGVLRPAWGGGGGAPDAGGGSEQGASLAGIGGGPSAPPVPAYTGGGGYAAKKFDPFTYEAFQAPEKFKAPTAADMANDPGYQFRLEQGQRALTNQASKYGRLISGDFAKGMQDYVQGDASQEFGQVYNRAASEYDRAYGNAFQTNQANNAGRLGAFNANVGADLGYGNLDVANRNVDLGYLNANNNYSLGLGNLALGNKQADQSYSLGQGNLGLGYLNANNNYNLGLGQQQLGWAGYGLNAQGQNFNQQYSLAQLGLGAAGQAGAYGSSYANNGTGLLTGQGNALAAGQAGAGAAYGGALTNIGNIGMGYGIYGATQNGGRG